MWERQLRDASTYFLVLELLNEGEAGLISATDQIPIDEIVVELEMRTKLDFGNRKMDWAQHFVRSPSLGTELERANLLMFLQTQEAMTRIWKKVDGL